MVGGEAYEKWTPDLGGLCDRGGAAVPVPVFAVGLDSATVLGSVQWQVRREGRWNENTRCDLAGDCDSAGGAVAGAYLSVGGFDVVDHPGSLIAAISQAVRS